MPGRPTRRNEETQVDARRTSGVIPAGAFAMLFAITGVFAYGIYLKAAGPSESAVDAPSRSVSPASAAPAPPAGARPSARPASPAPDAGLPTQTARGYGDEPLPLDSPGNPADLPPVIPEAATAGTLATPSLGGGSTASAPRTNSRPPTPASPSATSAAPGSASAPSPTVPPTGASAPPAAARTSPPAPRAAAPGPSAVQAPRVSPQASHPSAPPAKTRHEEPPDPGAPRTTPQAPVAAAAPPGPDEAVSRLAAAPRGTAPAVALRRAHEEFGAKRYKEAARSWNDWAAKAPAGSWTVQIAAIRLDKPASAGKLDGIAGREGAFVLPSGALPDGLAPVCVGVYPSEDAARRAAASMAPFPGSSNKPIPKPLSSLSH